MIYQMTDTEAKLKSAYSLILVEFPAGSICQCTNGKKVLNADNMFGNFVFAIPSSGDWTVVAYTKDGEHRKSVVVKDVQKGKTYSVQIKYEHYIVQDGILKYPYYLARATVSVAKVEDVDSLAIKQTTNSHIFIHIGPVKIDGGELRLTVPKGAKVPFWIDGAGDDPELIDKFGGTGFGIADSILAPSAFSLADYNYAATTRFTATSYDGLTHRLNLENIQGDYYVVMEGEGSQGQNLTLYAKDIFLTW